MARKPKIIAAPENDRDLLLVSKMIKTSGLTDQQIAEEMTKRGLPMAKKTVWKYRNLKVDFPSSWRLREVAEILGYTRVFAKTGSRTLQSPDIYTGEDAVLRTIRANKKPKVSRSPGVGGFRGMYRKSGQALN